ncbi:Neopullulanase [Sesbania bispinosa]|nr:Neopullulanase [Sesbania bispinosa]
MDSASIFQDKGLGAESPIPVTRMWAPKTIHTQHRQRRGGSWERKLLHGRKVGCERRTTTTTMWAAASRTTNNERRTANVSLPLGCLRTVNARTTSWAEAYSDNSSPRLVCKLELLLQAVGLHNRFRSVRLALQWNINEVQMTRWVIA